MTPSVVAVAASSRHTFTKPEQLFVKLLAGLGIEGDAHAGATVMHRYARPKNPSQPNLRQVHLIHEELIDELKLKGFGVYPGAMGENITTRGIALLDLPTGTRLKIGRDAVVEVTGLRSPCKLMEKFQKGLMYAVLDKGSNGEVIRKSGIMGIVLRDGVVQAGDAIKVQLPPEPHQQLQVV
jgi:MOSC domain-containing protein YiiM